MNQDLITEAVSTIDAAITEYRPVKVYALVSGGNDSTVVGHLAAMYGPRLDAFVHINTGIGVEATRGYVRDFVAGLGYPLIEKHAARTYEDLVLEYGFPGPGAHRYMYSWLKERPLREVRREAQSGRFDRVMFITGVRLSESRRRMGSVQPVQRDGNTVWVAPILQFESTDTWDYREDHDLPNNEVVALLHMSGECLCGAFSKPGELDWLGRWYPEVADRIRALERKAHLNGQVSCHWGPQSSKVIKESPGMLCTGCELEQQPAVTIEDQR